MCVLSSCLKMKSSQFSLTWKVSEQAQKACEAEVRRAERARTRAAPGRAGEARGGRTLPERRFLAEGRFRLEPAGLDSPAWPLGTQSDSTRGETGSMLSLNSTEVQSYNIWDFSITLTSIRFFFSFFYFLFFLLSSNFFSSMI